jgi:hypothetical protein
MSDAPQTPTPLPLSTLVETFMDWWRFSRGRGQNWPDRADRAIDTFVENAQASLLVSDVNAEQPCVCRGCQGGRTRP